jgi:hypothetical protein
MNPDTSFCAIIIQEKKRALELRELFCELFVRSDGSLAHFQYNGQKISIIECFIGLNGKIYSFHRLYLPAKTIEDFVGLLDPPRKQKILFNLDLFQ